MVDFYIDPEDEEEEYSSYEEYEDDMYDMMFPDGASDDYYERD